VERSRSLPSMEERYWELELYYRDGMGILLFLLGISSYGEYLRIDITVIETLQRAEMRESRRGGGQVGG
jgi:hypothetical protein